MAGNADTLSMDRFLPDHAAELVHEAGQVDIVIGIPSYNNAKTIGHVVRAAQAGLAKYFSGHRAVLINSDGGSTDGTPDVFRNSSIGDPNAILISHTALPSPLLSFPYNGIPGKGSAFAAIFTAASMLNAKACAVLDSDLRSVTPEWIELLLKPIVDGNSDFVSPLYQRHKYDGTITNSIVYPLTRALYGKRVRQPIGGDFGFSGELARFYMTKNVWGTDVAKFGVDIWMTTTALANGYRVCQSFMGAKIHDPKDPSSDLGGMLIQVVGTAFTLMEEYFSSWKDVTESQATQVFGFVYSPGYEQVNVNVKVMLDKFRLGVAELASLWSQFMKPEQIGELKAVAASDENSFHISDAFWTQIIFRFALAYKRKVFNREHLIRSLVPLYLGRTASWVLETCDMDPAQTEERIELLCKEYETNKPALVTEWAS